MQVNTREIKTSAKRKLVPENLLLEIQYRVSLGVPLNTAVKLILPEMSNVTALKLVKWYKESEDAFDDQDLVLFETIRASLFPPWAGQEQPDDAVYHGQFPYGYWE